MKGFEAKLAVAAAVWLLVLAGAMGVWGEAYPQAPRASPYPNISWALGVFVPQGAGLQQGGKVQWGGVSNVTVGVVLPNMTRPDGIVYAVLSVMTSDSTVLQAAAGASSDRSGWLAFAWEVGGLGSGTLTYNWVLNASEPHMAPNGSISMSIYEASGGWRVRVVGPSGASVDKAFPSGVAQTLKEGDQEVFALESYTRSQLTFQDMGNLTLSGVWLDGQKVVSGIYTYGLWDPVHSPVFVVGSSGASPPSFIYVGQAGPGSYYWNYAKAWVVRVNPFEGAGAIMAAAMLVGALAVVVAVVWLTRRPKGRAPPS